MKKYRSSIILWLVFEAIAIWLWQATGNLFFLLKDNRAFCKYICPMEVEVNKNVRSRKNATECILCQKYTKACPTKALSV